jgi:hypothetical protein
MIQTQTALSLDSTMIAIQSSGGIQPTIIAQAAALTSQSSIIASQETQIVMQAQLMTQEASQPVPQPSPSSLPLPTIIPVTLPNIVSTPSPVSTLDISSRIKNAKILLFEDMAGVYDTGRYVKQALDEMNASYIDVADMQGKFKQALLEENWDLVIASDENRSHTVSIKGEFFTYFKQQLEDGGSVIIEIWNLDTNIDSAAIDLLDECGLEYQGDLFDMRYQSQVYYATNPSHPLLNTPNQVRLENVANYWPLEGDLGDLVRKTSSSKATIILNRRPEFPESYGVFSTCYEGRMILQTFSSHQYRKVDSVHLWQNSITYALTNHFSIRP